MEPTTRSAQGTANRPERYRRRGKKSSAQIHGVGRDVARIAHVIATERRSGSDAVDLDRDNVDVGRAGQDLPGELAGGGEGVGDGPVLADVPVE